MIDKFDGKYSFLSNFHTCIIAFNGLNYNNSEAAFQAQKTLDDEERNKFCDMTAGQSKRFGRKVTLRADWETVKDAVMYHILQAKFAQHPEFAEALKATGEEELVEGNNWNDTYWGVCNNIGKNKLGKLLMQVRSEL